MSPIHHPLAVTYLHACAALASGQGPLSAADEAHTAWKRAGCPLYAEPPPNTIRVRIAVSVNKDGAWAAGEMWTDGGKTENDLAEQWAMVRADHSPGDRLSWIVADVPLPESTVEIEGTVQSASLETPPSKALPSSVSPPPDAP